MQNSKILKYEIYFRFEDDYPKCQILTFYLYSSIGITIIYQFDMKMTSFSNMQSIFNIISKLHDSAWWEQNPLFGQLFSDHTKYQICKNGIWKCSSFDTKSWKISVMTFMTKNLSSIFDAESGLSSPPCKIGLRTPIKHFATRTQWIHWKMNCTI